MRRERGVRRVDEEEVGVEMNWRRGRWGVVVVMDVEVVDVDEERCGCGCG